LFCLTKLETIGQFESLICCSNGDWDCLERQTNHNHCPKIWLKSSYWSAKSYYDYFSHM